MLRHTVAVASGREHARASALRVVRSARGFGLKRTAAGLAYPKPGNRQGWRQTYGCVRSAVSRSDQRRLSGPRIPNLLARSQAKTGDIRRIWEERSHGPDVAGKGQCHAFRRCLQVLSQPVRLTPAMMSPWPRHNRRFEPPACGRNTSAAKADFPVGWLCAGGVHFIRRAS